MYQATHLIPAALCLSLICGLTGCEQHLTNANLHEVKPDMSIKEVESILGQPRRIETAPALKSTEPTNLPVTRYVYEQKGRKVELTFVGERLASEGITGSFEK